VKPIQLSSEQQRVLWDSWLEAEVRAHYFADLCNRFQRKQRGVTFLPLVVGSGAVTSVLASLPTLVSTAFGLSTAVLGAWAFVFNYGKHVTDCKDLNLKWNQLAIEYEAIWFDMYSKKAPARFAAARKREAEIANLGTTMPLNNKLLLKWFRHVVSKRTGGLTK
jgi:hypothetical protein